jgi:phosphate transport system substrate-binding protein
MTHNYFKILMVVLLSSMMIFTGCSKKDKTDANKKTAITVKGSDTMVQLMSTLAENYMKQNAGSQVSVTGGGSGTGIAALLNGTTDIASSSRDIEQKEKDQFAQKNLNSNPVSIANDGVAIVVHKDNPVNELTMEQLAKIYTGEYTSWKDVGGPDQPIDVYSRENSSGTYKFFQEHVMAKKDYVKTAKLMPSTQTIIQSVTDGKWAIGYSGLGYTKGANVKILGIKKDDKSPAIMPSDKTVLDKTYSVARPLFLIFNGTPQDEMKKFLDFCLSDAGQKIVEETGYVKIK